MKTRILTSLTLALASVAAVPAMAQNSFREGAVYTMTNDVQDNRILIFDRASNGSLRPSGSISTGGTGTGASLGNQGGVILDPSEKWLFACNAGSHSISVFRVVKDGLELLDVKPSLGLTPVSLTFHGNLLYVVNADSDSVTGFYLEPDGTLEFIPGSIRLLSAVGTAPAQIEFTPNGDYFIVTEKATNQIGVFPMQPTGLAGQGTFFTSASGTPFGFAFGMRGQVIVSEANGGAPGAASVSTYKIDRNGQLVLISSIPNGETAACWIVISPDGQIAFASNTGSDSVSSFRVDFDGSLQLRQAQSANTGDAPLDMSLTNDGRFFYVLNSGAGTIGDYVVKRDSLISIPGGISGLPSGTNGLAVR